MNINHAVVGHTFYLVNCFGFGCLFMAVGCHLRYLFTSRMSSGDLGYPLTKKIMEMDNLPLVFAVSAAHAQRESD